MKLLLLIAIFLSLHLQAKVIVDHYGRSVNVPDKITKIYAASPPLSMSVLAFDPDLLAALNTPFSEEQKPYVGSAYTKPVVGGFFGQGKSPNLELLAAAKPDVIIVWGGMTGADKILKKLEVLGIPVLFIKNNTISDLIGQFKLYGELSGNTQRAKELIEYTKQTLSLIDSLQSKLQQQKQKTFYFAESIDGLRSECPGSFHLEPFLYTGSKNALDCKMSSNYGMEQISLETVLLSKPDLFIVMEPQFYTNIYRDKRFASLKAVKNKEVYLVPSKPFNYITRPPSFMRLMGIRWLIHTFYPNVLDISLKEEEKKFMKLFFKGSNF
ncbi:ABC transporter substrate-binding protein [Sulfurimonas marina]|uniref:ABC transporter substrate-binding protein n=1 Tax=Sulfurimonas marina TaxID=2590551 RepID=A0A7M1AWG1_9BACT|nr:ABC transporter substrate-binding protein [Sulfurimonas marina]QOP41760.1 ABC transporter substrate-binding protein [Sulfurimonas marina]